MTTTSATGSTTSSAIQKLTQTSTTATTSTEDLENRFLTLLVTQMKNQDPLNPMQNAELTSQLAQINTVKGVETLNQTLEKLLTSYSDTLSMQSAALVGKNVLSAGNKLTLTSDGAVGGISLSEAASRVTVTISDSSGKAVNTLELGAQKAGVADFYWDGKDLNGNALSAGNYTFTVSAKQGTAAVTSSALQFGTVSALVRTQDGFQLDVSGNGLVDFDAVQQIY